MALLEIKNLSFTYSLSNKPALSNLSFNIQAKEFVVICGPTGSGKSSLLKMFKKEIRPKGDIEGNIYYNAQDLNQLSLRESVENFGFVFQNPHSQIVSDKVYSELAFGLENLGIDPKQIAVNIAEIANYFGIYHWYNANTNTLSGGEKQILNLASSLIMRPKVILLDEPTSQLDPITAVEFIQTLRKINQDFGITIILVEHRLDELFSVCDRVIFMNEGKIIADNTPKLIGNEINDDRLFLNLPTLFRISKRLNLVSFPLTIKAGQDIIDNYKNEIRSLPKCLEKLNNISVELKNVYFKYNKNGQDIIEDLSLKIYENEIFSIVGSNGSGKSTLLKLIAKILNPYYGDVFINNKNIKKIKDEFLYSNNLAYLPQDPSDLMFSMSVKEELDNIKNTRIENLLKDLEIEPLLEKHPDDLSGGELQKVAFAKILLKEPKIILLDEPTKGLDSYLKNSLINILKKLKENNITIIIVSHDIEFAAKVSTRIGLLFAGEIFSINHPNNFFSNNYFYSTITNKISRHKYANAVTEEDLIQLIELNGGI